MQLQCDNQAAVHVASVRLCKDKTLMHLLRCLFYCYLPGTLNVLADNLSRCLLPFKGPGCRQRTFTGAGKPCRATAGSERLDVSILDRHVRLFAAYGIAPSTQRSYRAGLNRYLSFCTAFNVTCPLPASEQLLFGSVSGKARAGARHN